MGRHGLLRWWEYPNIGMFLGYSDDGIVDEADPFSYIGQFKAGKLDERYITVITREVLIALAYIHKNGIIHRDVKGSSV